MSDIQQRAQEWLTKYDKSWIPTHGAAEIIDGLLQELRSNRDFFSTDVKPNDDSEVLMKFENGVVLRGRYWHDKPTRMLTGFCTPSTRGGKYYVGKIGIVGWRYYV